MGISFGSKSVKPYVGSKEVQEAYVGSQLVYQSKPPYTYVFLGGENNYYLADYTAMQNGLAIAKESNVYRLAYPARTSNIPQLVINQVLGTHIKFTAKGGSNSSITVYGQSGSLNIQLGYINISGVADYTLYDVAIPADRTYDNISIRASGQAIIYMDAVRFETP